MSTNREPHIDDPFWDAVDRRELMIEAGADGTAWLGEQQRRDAFWRRNRRFPSRVELGAMGLLFRDQLTHEEREAVDALRASKALDYVFAAERSELQHDAAVSTVVPRG